VLSSSVNRFWFGLGFSALSSFAARLQVVFSFLEPLCYFDPKWQACKSGQVSPPWAALCRIQTPALTIQSTGHAPARRVIPVISNVGRHYSRHDMNKLGFSFMYWCGIFLALHSTSSYAEPYKSPSNRFTISFAEPWSRKALPDPTAELFVLCEASACGPTVLLGFGAFLDPNLKNETIAEFLKHANGNTIIQEVRQSPAVAKVAILREGRVKLGTAEAYEVLSELTLKSGSKRIRHTFMTFNAGYIYSVSLGCPPEAHAKALAAAQPVLNSFSFN
jgi:hypothetical protein